MSLGDLPTFNHTAIENSLHKIPGISENFIDFYETFIFASQTCPSHFHTKNLKHSTVYGPNRSVTFEVKTEKQITDLQKLFAQGKKKRIPKFLSILPNNEFSNSTASSKIEDFLAGILPEKSSYENWNFNKKVSIVIIGTSNLEVTLESFECRCQSISKPKLCCLCYF